MSTPAPLLPENTVRLGFEFMLGREIESEETLKAHQVVPSVAALREVLMNSAEFKEKAAPALLGSLRSMWATPQHIDTQVSDNDLRLLFERVRGQWQKLGDTEPHWSVITQDNFKAANFAQHEEQFYETGHHQAAMIRDLMHRSGREINPASTILELGCGTGRVTHALADMFAKVIAVDVSAGHLRLCEQMMRQRNKTNIQYMLLQAPSDIQRIPPIDFFFSTIVLQHNPPPVIYYFLSEIFSKVRSGGGAVLFQVPTSTPGYSFKAAEYLATPPPELEMHCLPMRAVFSLLARNGITPVEVMMDDSTGMLGSHTFFGVRE
jgi:2-polyprenyl-3-methyl-5-hydroxy-6-metoxy-1,4-benzoquinol methylase